MNADLMQRLADCEQSNKRMKKLFWLQALVFLCIAVWFTASPTQAQGPDQSGIIKAKEIVIVDNKGVVRARLGGNLPDAIIDGKVTPRGSNAAGLIIFDEEGIERGGYVTQDNGSNAMITLDSKHKQLALFVAGPEGEASALRLWNSDNGIELRSDTNGSRLSVSDQNGVKMQLPEIKPLKESTCKYFADLEKKYPGKNICRNKYSKEACDPCMQ